MPRYQISTPLNSTQFRELAATLRHFAGRYDDLATQVDGLDESLAVTHWISLQDALKEINKHVSAAFLAYGEAVVKRGSKSAADGGRTQRPLKPNKSPSRMPSKSKRG